MRRITKIIEQAYYPVPKSTPPAVRPDFVLPIITDAQLEDKAFVQAMRERGYAITLRYGITPALWKHFLITSYRDFEGCFKDKKGVEYMINTNLFEIREKTLFFGSTKEVVQANEMLREKFEVLFCIPCQKPRFRNDEAREFFKVAACILSTLKTEQDCLITALKIKVANDNIRQK